MLLAIAKINGQMAIAQWPTDRLALREGPRAGDRKKEPDGAPGRFLEKAVGAPVEGTTPSWLRF